MTERNQHEEPTRDPKLKAALERLEGRSALGAVESELLARRIAFSAIGPLARLRKRPATGSLWDITARWSRAAIPIGAAAAIALALLLPRDFSAVENGYQLSERAGISAVFTGAMGAGDAVDAIVGPADGDWLLAAAVEGETEP